PSSYLARSVSRGKSSDSIASTMVSSFFSASSKGKPGGLAGGVWATFFKAFGTTVNLKHAKPPVQCKQDRHLQLTLDLSQAEPHPCDPFARDEISQKTILKKILEIFLK